MINDSTVPEHAFDPASVRTGPYSMFEEGDDPSCLCGAPWDTEADGCITQQPGWTPPPPCDGPTLEELLPAPTQPVADATGVATPDSEAAALERYEAALASGLSDYEAREEGWPSR
jgi:hypothetical protein